MQIESGCSRLMSLFAEARLALVDALQMHMQSPRLVYPPIYIHSFMYTYIDARLGYCMRRTMRHRSTGNVDKSRERAEQPRELGRISDEIGIVHRVYVYR